MTEDDDKVKSTRFVRAVIYLALGAGGLIGALGGVAPAHAEPIDITATLRPFNPDAPLQTGQGHLIYRGGLELRASLKEFGGFSAAHISADGRALLALSDTGSWFSATLRYDQTGRLGGIEQARLAPMTRPPGKGRFDPEGLVIDADGALIVSTERKHRVLRYDNPAGALDADRLARLAPRVLDVPEGFATLESNAGIETLVRLSDGRLLAIEEGREDAGDALSRAWLIPSTGASATLSLKRSANFRPTDAALLPNGDVLLLERRYTEIGGVAARLRVIEGDTIKPGAVLDGTIIATLIPPVTIDNMEALALFEREGTLHLLMMSDDNFNTGLQRTLLLHFVLKPAVPK